MKLLFAVVFLATLMLGRAPLKAEDWKTIDGKVYAQVKVLRVDPDAVTIMYRDGGGVIPLMLLPEDLQKRFHYDPVAAKAAADLRDKADFDNARALRDEKRQIVAQRLAVAKAEDAAEPATTPQPAPANSTHHSMGDLVNFTGSLQDNDTSGNHYSSGNAVSHGPLSGRSADEKHYSMGSLCDSASSTGR